jgi:hypothetical protein
MMCTSWADGPEKAGGPGGSPPAGGLGGSALQAGRLGWHWSVGGGAVCAFFAQSAPFGWVEILLVALGRRQVARGARFLRPARGECDGCHRWSL